MEKPKTGIKLPHIPGRIQLQQMAEQVGEQLIAVLAENQGRIFAMTGSAIVIGALGAGLLEIKTEIDRLNTELTATEQIAGKVEGALMKKDLEHTAIECEIARHVQEDERLPNALTEDDCVQAVQEEKARWQQVIDGANNGN